MSKKRYLEEMKQLIDSDYTHKNYFIEELEGEQYVIYDCNDKVILETLDFDKVLDKVYDMIVEDENNKFHDMIFNQRIYNIDDYKNYLRHYRVFWENIIGYDGIEQTLTQIAGNIDFFKQLLAEVYRNKGCFPEILDARSNNRHEARINNIWYNHSLFRGLIDRSDESIAYFEGLKDSNKNEEELEV